MTSGPVNRFTLPPANIEYKVAQVKTNRKLGGKNLRRHLPPAVHWGTTAYPRSRTLTYDIDQIIRIVHQNCFTEFLKRHTRKMTCPRTPASPTSMVTAPWGLLDQPDKDMCMLHVVEKRADGIVVRGAIYYQTGSLSCHEMIPPAHPRLKQGGQGVRPRLCRPVRCGRIDTTWSRAWTSRPRWINPSASDGTAKARAYSLSALLKARVGRQIIS